jgi:hypothetical protein
MLLIDYRELGWWYWLVIACLITAGLAGHPIGFDLAVGTAALQWVHFALRERSATAFPVEVRLWYLLLLLLALPLPLRGICWIPLIGTWVRLASGYCTMARCVSLWPWNRCDPLSLQLLRRTFLSPPVRGSVLQGLPGAAR